MNILILTGKFGMGHYSAANALSEELKSKLKNSNIFIEDIFVDSLKEHCKILYDDFSFLMSRGQLIYNWVYRRTENVEKKNHFPMKPLLMSNLKRLIMETNADAVISTLPICSQLVSEYKRTSGQNLLLITCITDVSSHCEWLYPQTDFYLAAAPKIKDSLIQKGVPAKCIIVSGIPVRSQFKIKSTHHVATEKHLLIMGGGLGLLPKSKAFYKELSKLQNIKTTIITGKNKSLYRWLHNRYSNITVLAYVDDVYRYMQDADLIISKPGGITLYEAIFAEIPLMMFSPFLEQEIKNGDFVMENSLGILMSKKPQNSIEEIRNIVNDNELLDSIRLNMQHFKSLLDTNALSQVLLQYQEQGVYI